MNRAQNIHSVLSHAVLSDGFWVEALMTVVHLINGSPNRAINCGILEEIWNGRMPSYGHLRVFGYETYVHVPKELRKKLDLKSKKCIFMGYGTSGEMGYCLWDLESHKIIKSHDVIFNEKKMHDIHQRC